MSRHVLSPTEACLAIGVGLAVGAAAGGVGSLIAACLASAGAMVLALTEMSTPMT